MSIIKNRLDVAHFRRSGIGLILPYQFNRTTMKRLISTLSFGLLLSLSIPVAGQAQTKFAATAGTVAISGTSTIHNWEMTAQKPAVEAVFVQDPSGVLSDLSNLSFTLPAEALKSGKGTMDKNAYKALKTGANRNITFVASNATVTPAGNNAYLVKCNGKLTIAGTTRETDLQATCKLNTDKSLQVTGSKKLKMTDYKVEPPSFAFGTVTTGDAITLNFNVTLKK